MVLCYVVVVVAAHRRGGGISEVLFGVVRDRARRWARVCPQGIKIVNGAAAEHGSLSIRSMSTKVLLGRTRMQRRFRGQIPPMIPPCPSSPWPPSWSALPADDRARAGRVRVRSLASPAGDGAIRPSAEATDFVFGPPCDDTLANRTQDRLPNRERRRPTGRRPRGRCTFFFFGCMW